MDVTDYIFYLSKSVKGNLYYHMHLSINLTQFNIISMCRQ